MWINDIFEGLEFLHETRSKESNQLFQLVYLHCLRILAMKMYIFTCPVITSKQNFSALQT